MKVIQTIEEGDEIAHQQAVDKISERVQFIFKITLLVLDAKLADNFIMDPRIQETIKELQDMVANGIALTDELVTATTTAVILRNL